MVPGTLRRRIAASKRVGVCLRETPDRITDDAHKIGAADGSAGGCQVGDVIHREQQLAGGGVNHAALDDVGVHADEVAKRGRGGLAVQVADLVRADALVGHELAQAQRCAVGQHIVALAALDTRQEGLAGKVHHTLL